MSGQAQPQYITVQEIIDRDMESRDYDNIKSTEAVSSHPVTCNALSTVKMYDPTNEFPELFPDEKRTELPPLRYPMESTLHRIDVIPESAWSTRCTSTYNQMKDEITAEINRELGTGGVVPSRSINATGMFTQPKRYIPHEARFLLACITSCKWVVWEVLSKGELLPHEVILRGYY